MNPFTVKSYWKSYKGLPKKIQRDADRKFDLWKKNPFHPSLNFKCVNMKYNIWSVRVTMDYRALSGCFSCNAVHMVGSEFITTICCGSNF